MKQVAQDEGLIASLGHRTGDGSRGRLLVVVDGRARVTMEGRAVELGAGAIVTADQVALTALGDEPLVVFEIESAMVSSTNKGTLGRHALATVAAVSDALRAEQHEPAVVLTHIHALERAFAAEGLVLDGLSETFAAESDAADAEFMATLDAVLDDVRGAPASIDWESRASASRRTLTRRTRTVHERYGLSGVRRRTDWRAVRDLNRLVVAMLFLTKKNATLPTVAAAVGYGSTTALCHAFAHAGLPPPGKIRVVTLAT